MYSLWLEYLVSIKVTAKTYNYLPYNCSLCSFRVNDFVTTNPDKESPTTHFCGLYLNWRLLPLEYTTTIYLYFGGLLRNIRYTQYRCLQPWMVILHICDLYLNLLQFFSLRNMKNMTQVNNNNISKNRENAFYPFYSTAVSRQFVSIFCAVKIIFQIKIVQEYLSTTCPVQKLIVKC